MVTIEDFRSLVYDIESDLNAGLDPGRLHLISRPAYKTELADSSMVCIIPGRRAGVALVLSSPGYPEAVREATERAKRVADALPHALAVPVVHPIHSGRWQGASFAVYERYHPVSRRRGLGHLQRRLIRNRVTDWLSAVACAAQQKNLGDDTIRTMFHQPLAWLESATDFPGPIRQAAAGGLANLETGRVTPILTIEHGDLWLGNVLLPQVIPPSGSFRIIDWGGARLMGYPCIDMIRFVQSITRNDAWGRDVMRRHLAALGVSRPSAELHLLASLGSLGQNLGEFPRARLVELADRTLQSSTRLLGN